MKNIVMFGAASAIAQETMRLFAQDKARMVLVDRDEQRLQAVADDLHVRGAKLTVALPADLTKLEEHKILISKAKQALGGDINLALIAYGTLGNQKAGEQDFDEAHRELLTNFTSVASLLTILANEFEKGQVSSKKVPDPFSAGSVETKTIAVISSVAGDRGRQSNYIYGAAKGALTVFLSGLRNRLAGKNIHIITIKPGLVDTPMTKDFKKGILWVKPHTVAKGIYNAIQKKKDVVYIPFFWRYIMWIIKAIPEPIFKKMHL